jgi:hypothetical protein
MTTRDIQNAIARALTAELTKHYPPPHDIFVAIDHTTTHDQPPTNNSPTVNIYYAPHHGPHKPYACISIDPHTIELRITQTQTHKTTYDLQNPNSLQQLTQDLHTNLPPEPPN